MAAELAEVQVGLGQPAPQLSARIVADASDGWDHAAKAVEAILIPIVVPSQAGPHLGHVLGALEHHSEQFELIIAPIQKGKVVLATPEERERAAIETLVGMLRLVWPNSDRHSGPERREPTLDEARAVVHLAVTIVQWARSETLNRRA